MGKRTMGNHMEGLEIYIKKSDNAKGVIAKAVNIWEHNKRNLC